MATRNINTFIQHLMNENLAATQAAVTGGTAVKQKKREQRSDAEKRDDALRGLGIYGPFKPKGSFRADAEKESTDSGNYGPKKAGGVRDRMEKAAKSSGSMGGY